MKTVFAALTLFFCTQMAFAQEESLPVMPTETVTSSNNLKIGPQIISYRYVEPGLISHSGFLYGVTGEFFWKASGESIKGVLAGDLVAGKLNYDGALCEVKTNVCTNYSSKTNDLILRLTHRFDFKVTDEFHVFLGPGLRYLIDKGDDAGFYTRIGTYLFAPMGFNYEIPFNSDSGLIIDLEYDLFISGTMQSKLSEVNSSYADITHKQGAGSGHKVTVGYKLNQRTLNPVVISLFYENWNIGASNLERLYINGSPSTSAFVEPKNFSESVGLKGAISF